MSRLKKVLGITLLSVLVGGLAIGLPISLTTVMHNKDIKHYVRRVINDGIWEKLYGKGVYYYKDFQYLLLDYENYATMVGVQNPSVFTDPNIKQIKLEFRLNRNDSIYSLHRIDSATFWKNNEQINPITNNAEFILPGTCDMLSYDNTILDDSNIAQVMKDKPPFFPKGFSKIVILNPILSKLVNDHFHLIFGDNYTKDQIQLTYQG